MCNLFQIKQQPEIFNYRTLMKTKKEHNTIDDIVQKQLWIYRTFIFYQLFMYNLILFF